MNKLMMKYLLVFMGVLMTGVMSMAQEVISREDIAPGIVKLTLGMPDSINPYALCTALPKIEALKELSTTTNSFPIAQIQMERSKRGCEISVPLGKEEQLYGFGLQIGSFEQRGLKKKPIVNDNPLNSLGYTHAPQPFYVSTAGYGILVNTLRYTTFYCGTNQKQAQQSSTASGAIATSTSELYKKEGSGDHVYIDVPLAKGIEVYVFTGTDLLDVIQRYNLFSGGGCMPPLWGLGLKYRVKGDFHQEAVLKMADYFRKAQIPCDVIGIEPGWQTASYSCSYVWEKTRFPDHVGMLKTLQREHFRVNLWEHAFVNPSSPIWESLQKYSGNFLVWNGLVPDFSLPEARKIFGDYHKTLVDEGISGFKLDECDNSNIASGESTWSFPEMSHFPSGMDGEQMHQAFGSLYVRTINHIYEKENTRSYLDYRSSGLFVSSIPAVLYSDIYQQKDYVQMLCNSAFGGLLWSPEVRKSNSAPEFFHRLQTALLAPQSVVNSWFLLNVPWLQYDEEKNNKNELLDNASEMENQVRSLVNTRMQLVPYLYDAFAAYYQRGIPPFRPLVLDYPNDENVRKIDNQYLIGQCIMATPLTEEANTRTVYFPAGTWYNFNTNEKYIGGKSYTLTFAWNTLPIFVKAGSILPLAEPVLSITDSTQFKITAVVYGDPKEARSATLFEDDGISYNFKRNQFNVITLSIKKGKGVVSRKGPYKNKRYLVSHWKYQQ